MIWFQRLVTSAIGRKVIVGLSGLGLVAFIIGHVAGNMQLFLPSEAFNEYAEGLHGLSFFWLIEVGLIVAFVTHITFVLWLAIDNKKARAGQRYAVEATSKQPPKNFFRFMASKTMVLNGLVLLFFIVIHVWDFRLHHEMVVTEMGGDLKSLVVDKLQVPWRAMLYMAGSVLIGLHLYHGFQSAFRSLGVHNSRLTPILEKTSLGIAVLVGAGFFAMPLWVLATH